jgi:DNA invertase Pin-like site-specific DNA recombinase
MEIPRMENFEVQVPEREPSPVWENPESALFVEWYLEHSSRPEEEQSPEFKEFLAAVEIGEKDIPTPEAIARYKIDELRHRKSEL